MIWVGIALAFFILLFLIITVPRIRFSGRYNEQGLRIELRALLTRLVYDSTIGVVAGRVFFVSFHGGGETDVGQAKEPRNVKWDVSIEAPPRNRPNARFILRLAGRILSLLKKLLKSIHTDYLYARLVVATSDPMTTAVIFGALQPVSMLNRIPARRFTLDVDFERSQSYGNAEWSFSVRPIVWIVIVGWWMIGLPWREIYREFRRPGGVKPAAA